MTDVKIKSKNKKVIYSGTLISFNDEPLNLKFLTPIKISITFQFLNSEDKELKVEPKLKNDLELELVFYNFNLPLGAGNSEPTQLGKINSKKLYLNYRVYSFNEGGLSKTLQYTFYLED